MKKIITIDELAICFCSAAGYGLGFLIPDHFGCPMILSIIICFALGLLIDEIAKKIVFSQVVQSRHSRRVLSWIICIGLFVACSAIALKFLGENINGDLQEEIMTALGMPIFSLVFSFIVRYLKTYRLRKKYGDGSGGYIITDKDRAYMDSLNGKNQPVTGDYDAKNAVKTETGIYVGKKDKGVISYLGIPYALPPTGERRWKKPMPLAPSDAVFEAFYFGPSALQPENEANPLNYHQQSEDCLYLNIWKAEDKKEKKKDNKKSVLIYLHDGNFISGGSANPIGKGDAYVENHPDTLFVSFNYRLGMFGFADFSQVAGGEDYPDAINCGLLDQIEALKWIKANIHAFGGDPDNITLMGSAAGGTAALLLSTIEDTRGLFKKIMIFSATSEYVYEDTTLSVELGRALAQEFNADTMDDLMKIPSEKLKKLMGKYANVGCCPSCGSSLLPNEFFELFKGNNIREDLEIIIGLPKNEISNTIATIGKEETHKTLSILFDQFKQFFTQEELDKLLGAFDLKKTETEITDEEIFDFLNDVSYLLSPLCIGSVLAEKGNPVHCFLWDVKPSIESMQANATSFLTTIFDNFTAGESLGYINDKNIKEITQTLIQKFISGEELKLHHNEIVGINKLDWPLYTKETRSVLRFNQKKIEVVDHYLEDKTIVTSEILNA